MSMKLISKASIAASLIIMISSTAFADGAAVFTAKGCAACHGADAKSPITPAYPKIAGQSADYLKQQLGDIKSGARNNGQTAVMKGIMASVSDEDIEVLSTYLSGL